MLDQVTYDIRGIVWLTDRPLAKFPEHFKELDYLFDGLIAQHVSHLPKEETKFEKNIFTGQSFNRPLVLIQMWNEDKAKLEKELSDALVLIPGKGEHPQVLVLGESANSFPEKSLKKKHDLRFQLF